MKFVSLIAGCILMSPGFGQEPALQVNALFTSEQLTVDGFLNEAAWQKAGVADDFWQFFPTDSVRATHQTSVWFLYNERTLYVGIRAASAGNDFVTTTLKRDFRGSTTDNVTLLFDTFSDGTNAFFFGATPFGVQREGQISQGGSRDGFSNTWDTKWIVESSMHEDEYIIEMAIPFSSLKFPEGATQWRFQCIRWDLQTNEQSAWARVPQNQRIVSLAFMGNLVFEKPLGKSKAPVYLIPYVNALTGRDYELSKWERKLKVGADAKMAIGNSMNLDLTINPDFSNVEVDQFITNLTRFELRLPEKRQFFIDNSDLFESFGNLYNEARPFFSRRIGLVEDTSGDLIQNQIIAGARLSGKLNEDWRLGFLNIQTDKDLPNRIASYNNMMFALQRRVFSRSNVGVFMVNRQTFDDYDFLKATDRFNRVIGADYNLLSENNEWTGRFYVHKSFQPGDSKGNISSQATVGYNTRNYEFITDWVYIDKDFRADLGFVPRTDMIKSGNGITRNFYPVGGMINSYGIRLLSLIYWRPGPGFRKTDHRYSITWNASFRNQSTLELGATNNYIFLTDDFDPTGKEDVIPLPGNTDFRFTQFSAQYRSNQARVVTFEGEATAGHFYNGTSYSVGGVFGVRMQPWALISLAFNYDGIRLPDPYPDADIWLVSPRFDITFTRSIFWSTLVQYSNQRDNLGINSRLQWRFAPLSDLYLVYNDNYYVNNFMPRYRSFNLKFTYWFSV